MEIDFFINFGKRTNSTKRPTVEGIVMKHTLTGILKEPCSILEPVINIQNPITENPPCVYTYAYIPRFYRYYFVRDWVWNDGLWTVRLEVDVLATYKPHIGDTYAYIDRCSQDYDGSIIDMRYIATTDFNIESHDISTSWFNVNPSSGGCYVVGIINGSSAYLSQTGGAVTYYAMDIEECQNLMRYLLSDQFLSDNGFPTIMTAAQQMTNDMAKAFINPINYISSVTWFPLPVNAFSQEPRTNINVGYWAVAQTIATGRVVNAYSVILHCGVNIPIHPQAAGRGKYLNYAPYTKLTLVLPPFGQIPIDTSFCEIGSYLYCDIFVDAITGKAELIVKIEPDDLHLTDNNVVVTTAVGMFGVPIQISQINADFYHAAVESVQAGLSTGAGVLSALTMNLGGAASNASTAVSHMANAVDCVMPQIRNQGVDGSFLFTFIQPRLCAHHLIIVDEDNSELGRPLRANRYIRDLPGFVKCFEVTVDYSCFKDENTRIHNYLMSGFFWE